MAERSKSEAKRLASPQRGDGAAAAGLSERSESEAKPRH